MVASTKATDERKPHTGRGCEMIFYENGTKYAICGGAVYTMADLRNGYRIITGLGNGADMTDAEIIAYMEKELSEK